jgi:plasmid stabilization system protein ParE
MDFRVAPQAESDLDEIWYFLAIQSSSIDIADRVIDSITARFALLARQPYIGRRRDEEPAARRTQFRGRRLRDCVPR